MDLDDAAALRALDAGGMLDAAAALGDDVAAGYAAGLRVSGLPAIDDVTAELPMFALTFTANARPMIIGSDSGWFTLAGMMARPAATSLRTSSTSTPSRAATNRISGVTRPARAQASWVRIWSVPTWWVRAEGEEDEDDDDVSAPFPETGTGSG